MRVFNSMIHSVRPAFAGLLAVLAATLIAACGDGGDVRIVALTRTPTPEATEPASGSPSAPLPPTVLTATATPAPSGRLPDRPDDLLTGGLLVAGYLAGGNAAIAGCLPGLVNAWELAPVPGERCVFADLDGDGSSEFVFAVAAGEQAGSAGDVWFFEGADEDFRLFSSARVLANQVLQDVAVEAASDLTGDRFPDIVISARVCGADACARRLLIASAHRGAFEDLAPAGLDFTGLDAIRVEDLTEDGLDDVVLAFAYEPDREAGPQRDRDVVLNWAGLKFFDSEEPEPPRYLFHAITDADELFEARDYGAAREAYEAAADDTSLVDWRVETGEGSGRRELVPYALLRASLAALRDGDEAGALELLARAAGGFAASLHGQVASILAEAIAAGVPQAEACDAAEDYLRPHAGRYAEIWDYGHANPVHRITDLCR